MALDPLSRIPTTDDDPLARIPSTDDDPGLARIPSSDDFGPEAPAVGPIRGAADTAIEGVQGVLSGGQMLANLAGAGNPVSRTLGDAVKGLDEYLSPELQYQKKRRGEIAAAAAGNPWEEAKAAVGAFAENPLGATVNAIGTAVPTLIQTVVTKGRGVGAMGVAQGVGATKGSIYESVEQRAVKEGYTPEQAAAMADAAQGYTGENADQLALGGGLGWLAAKLGFEPLLTKRLAGAPLPGPIRTAAAGGLGELPTEAAQGGAEQLAGNVAQARAGFDQPLMEGVAGAATLEGLAGFGSGAVIGAATGLERRQPGAPAPRGDVGPNGMPALDDPGAGAGGPPLDPAAGPLSRAGIVAQQTGATADVQAAAAAAAAAEVEGKGGATAAQPGATAARPGPIAAAARGIPPVATPPAGSFGPDDEARALGAMRAQAGVDEGMGRDWTGAQGTGVRPPATVKVSEPPAVSFADAAEDATAALEELAAALGGTPMARVRANEAYDRIEAEVFAGWEHLRSGYPEDEARAAPILAELARRLRAEAPPRAGSITDAAAGTPAGTPPPADVPRGAEAVASGAQPATPAPAVDAPRAPESESNAFQNGAPPPRYQPDVRGAAATPGTSVDPKARWIKAVADANRLMPAGMPTIGTDANGRLTFQGDPTRTKQGRALLGAYEEARRAGATDDEILGALRAPATTPAPPASNGEQSARPTVGVPGMSDPRDGGKSAAPTVDARAQAAATSLENDLPQPTPAQQQAGNYRKGRLRIGGLDVSIENPAGSQRSGTKPDGTPWSVTMRDHYGYVRRTEGADGDQLDVFVKAGTPEDADGPVFVVDQNAPDGSFDEHKAMIGYASREEAEAAYRANYDDGGAGFAAITGMSQGDFRRWVRSRRTKKPLAGSLWGRAGEKRLERQQQDREAAERYEAERPAREAARWAVRADFGDAPEPTEAELADAYERFPGARENPEQTRRQFMWDRATRELREAYGDPVRAREAEDRITDEVLEQHGGNWTIDRDPQKLAEFEGARVRAFRAEADRVRLDAATPGTLENRLRAKRDAERWAEAEQAYLRGAQQEFVLAMAEVRRLVADGRLTYDEAVDLAVRMDEARGVDELLGALDDVLDAKEAARLRDSLERGDAANDTAPPDGTDEQRAAIERYSLPAGTVFRPGRGTLGAGKVAAEADGESSNLHATADAAAAELREFLDAKARREQRAAELERVSRGAAEKIRRGEQPTDAEWSTILPGFKAQHTYARQPEISPFLTGYLGVPSHNIRGSIGRAAGTLTSDTGAQYPIVYFRRLAEVFGTDTTPAPREPGPAQAEAPAPSAAPERWQGYVVQPIEGGDEYVLGEPRADGSRQNLARFRLNAKGRPVGIEHFNTSEFQREQNAKAIRAWADSLRRTGDDAREADTMAERERYVAQAREFAERMGFNEPYEGRVWGGLLPDGDTLGITLQRRGDGWVFAADRGPDEDSDEIADPETATFRSIAELEKWLETPRVREPAPSAAPAPAAAPDPRDALPAPEGDSFAQLQSWWDSALTPSGRRRLLEQAKVRLPDAVKWRHVSDAHRARILEVAPAPAAPESPESPASPSVDPDSRYADDDGAALRDGARDDWLGVRRAIAAIDARLAGRLGPKQRKQLADERSGLVQRLDGMAAELEGAFGRDAAKELIDRWNLEPLEAPEAAATPAAAAPRPAWARGLIVEEGLTLLVAKPVRDLPFGQEVVVEAIEAEGLRVAVPGSFKGVVVPGAEVRGLLAGGSLILQPKEGGEAAAEPAFMPAAEWDALKAEYETLRRRSAEAGIALANARDALRDAKKRGAPQDELDKLEKAKKKADDQNDTWYERFRELGKRYGPEAARRAARRTPPLGGKIGAEHRELFARDPLEYAKRRILGTVPDYIGGQTRRTIARNNGNPLEGRSGELIDQAIMDRAIDELIEQGQLEPTKKGDNPKYVVANTEPEADVEDDAPEGIAPGDETFTNGGLATMAPEDVLPAPAERFMAWKATGGKVLSMEEARAQVEAWKAEALRVGDTEDHSREIVFSLFDHSGAWSKPWVDAGYNVIRYDIKDGDDLLSFMPIADIEALRAGGYRVVGVLAAPPCTSFAVSGARWWDTQHDVADVEMVRRKYGGNAAEFFDTPLDYANALVAATQAFIELANPEHFHAVENPIGRIAQQNDLPAPLLAFDPHHYGDPYTKRTQLWGDFDPKLPTANVEPTEGSRMHVLRGDNAEDKAARSLTPEGFAYAFFMANHRPRLELTALDQARWSATQEKNGGPIRLAYGTLMQREDIRDGTAPTPRTGDRVDPAADGAQTQDTDGTDPTSPAGERDADGVRDADPRGSGPDRGNARPAAVGGAAPADDPVLAGASAEDGRGAGAVPPDGRTGDLLAGQDAPSGDGEPSRGDGPNGRPGGGRAGVASSGAGSGRGGRRGKRVAPPADDLFSAPAPQEAPATTPTKAAYPDFRIEDPETLIGGTPKVRFRRNMEALAVLDELNASGSIPTAEQMTTLARYIGWGSFGQELFQGTWASPRPKDGWEKEDAELRARLGEAEWKSAQASIINAHYTDPPTVQMMWRMVESMGFTGGRVLEPSIGVGNFFGLMPPALAERSMRAGIELDLLTAQIAKLLYPNANIQQKGYQDSHTADGFYDLIIGNWPFAKDGPSDRRYNAIAPSLHDYFFLKAVDQVREGGLVVGITSAGTMDKQAKATRLALSKQADLVAAFRLPSGAFEKYAGTSVVTDVIILQKRPAGRAPSANTLAFLDVEQVERDGGQFYLNRYYVQNPTRILGELGFGTGSTYGRPSMIVRRTDDLQQRMDTAVALVPANIVTPREKPDHINYVANQTTARQRSITETKDGLFQVQGDYLAPLHEVLRYKVKSIKETKAREDQLRALAGMAGQYEALVRAERDGEADAEKKRERLRQAYFAFTERFGQINLSFGLGAMKSLGDPNFPLLAALERNTGTRREPVYVPARILSEPTVRPRRSLDRPTVRDALVLARNESMDLDVDRIAEKAGKPRDVVVRELLDAGAIFQTPAGNYEVADVYLSGNVRRKMREAQDAKAAGLDMDRNIAALERVMPATVPYFNIEAQMGATWVPIARYEQFVAELLGLAEVPAEGLGIVNRLGTWRVKFPDEKLNGRAEATTVNGHGRVRFDKLLAAAFNNVPAKVWDKDSDGNRVLNEQATKEATEKAAQLREKFAEWLWKDPTRTVELEGVYNEVMNAIATPRFDGSFLTLEGMALHRGDSPFALRQHQIDAIYQALVNQRSMNFHEVGTGKTYTMAGIAVESRRYGLARKPLLLAHNANSASVAAEAQEMYPGARVLYIDNLSPDSLDVTMRQIANDDWDLVVVPHSLISRFALSEPTLMELVADDIAALESEALEAAAEDNVKLTVADMDDEEKMKKVRSVTAKQLVHARNRIKKMVRDQSIRASREGAIPFEDVGIDMILVDEAHEFKKIDVATKMQMKGLNKNPSDRSLSLKLLTQYVKSRRGGTGVHTFTGTPITNTLNEIYVQQRYVMELDMARDGLKDWDGWFNTFASATSDVELTATGEFEPVTRLASFVNVAELRRMIGQFTSVVFADDMPEFKPRETLTGKRLDSPDLTPAERDELENGRTANPIGRPYKRIITDVAPMNDSQRAIFAELRELAADFKNDTKRGRRERMLKGDPSSPVIVETNAAKASLDARLYDPTAEDDPQSKVNRAVRRIVEIHRRDAIATQVVFSERGAGKDQALYLYGELVDKLVAAGIPRAQIAVVDGSTPKARRKEIADAMNRSEIRVVLGSTATLGVGVNMQRNLRAMHHLDAPWMPGDLEQRNGRGHRQGNTWNTVLEYRYITERIDGRRWQVLVVKQRFITAFLKADENVRVIDGDAASADEGDDLSETLSDAAGDPRIMLRNKYQQDVAKLEGKERLHTYALYDMRRKLDELRESLPRLERELAALRADLESVADLRSRPFSIQLKGETFDKREDADGKLERLAFTAEVSNKPVPIGLYGRFVLATYKPYDRFETEIQIIGEQRSYARPSLASIDYQLRAFKDTIEKREKQIAEATGSIPRLEAAAQAPFARAADLEKKKKLLADVERDLQDSPEPAPAWLRHGAPMGAQVRVKGADGIVEGHRAQGDRFVVIVSFGDETRDVPYYDVLDPSGTPLYERRAADIGRWQTDRGSRGRFDRREGPVRFSRRTERTLTPAVGRVQLGAAIARLTRDWKGAPPVVVLDSPAQASFAAPADAEGAYWQGTVYLFRENLASLERAAQVVLHEAIGHSGVVKVLGQRLGLTMRNLYESNAQVRAAADRWLAGNGSTDKVRATEEAVAQMAESGEAMRQPWWARVVAAIRNALRAAGFVRTWTDADVADLLARAYRATRDGAPAARAAGDPAPAFANEGEAPVFYSELQRRVAALPQGAATGRQWLATLKSMTERGMPADEIEATGVDYWLTLADEARVTKDELIGFLEGNAVRVGEVVNRTKGQKEREAELRDELDALDARAREAGWWFVTDHEGAVDAVERLDDDEVSFQIDLDAGTFRNEDGEEPPAEILAMAQAYVNASAERFDILEGEPAAGQPKFQGYTIPGESSEYRELLITLPKNASGTFIVPHHWTTPNVAVHARFDTRTDADGKRVLFVRELQSDWGQGGRKRGFRAEPNGPIDTSRWLVTQVAQGRYEVLDETGEAIGGTIYANSDAEALDMAVSIRRPLRKDNRVPQAPFVGKTDAWVGLMVKRLIRYAAENGHERIVFPTGEQMVEQFNLARQVREISYAAARPGEPADAKRGLWVYGDRDEQVLSENIAPSKLPELIGEELADRLLATTPAVPKDGLGGRMTFHRLEGLDLTMGGEGMRGFYDRILPKVVADVSKKLGGPKPRATAFHVPPRSALFPNATSLRERIEQPVSIDLTPALRERVMGGVPLFSRASDYVARLGMGYVPQPILDRIHDWTATSKGFNWWQKSLGLPYFAAKKNAAFKVVFDRVQQAIGDISHYANLAADNAPNLLPKLEDVSRETLRRFRAVKPEDVKAIARPIFQGTLWSTDPGKGRVWTDDELRRDFGLTPEQIGYYKEYRAAVGRSLDDLGKADLLRIAGDDAPEPIRQAALAAPDVQAAARVIERHFAELIEQMDVNSPTGLAMLQNLNALAEQIRGKADRVTALKENGYAPLSRFGRYSVTVQRVVADPITGRQSTVTDSFKLYDTERAANAAAREAQANLEEGQSVRQGVLSQKAYELFAMISPDTLETFAEAADIPDRELFQQFIRLARSERSALKRLIERKGTEGYSEDLPRVLANFITSNARATSSMLHGKPIADAVDMVRRTAPGDVADEATALAKFALAPEDWTGRIRGLMFIHFIGGNAGSALANMTQTFLMTIPYLSQYGKRDTAKVVTAAMRDVTRGAIKPDSPLGRALEQASRDGIVSPQEIHHLYAEGGVGLGKKKGTRLALQAWGSMFALAEQFNRRVAFVAAFRMATDQRMPDPYAFAVETVQLTQGIYNRGNRSALARVPGLSPLFTFKQYMIQYLEFAARLPREQKLVLLVMLALFAGIEGFPFADDLDDLLDTAAQMLGFNWQAKRAKRELLDAIMPSYFGRAGAQFVLRGFSGLPFMPFDVSARLGVANLIPGTGVLLNSREGAREVAEFAGVPGSFIGGIGEGIVKAARGDVLGAAESAVPVAIANAIKGLRMFFTGYYTDRDGKRVVDTDTADAVLKGFGLQPNVVARGQMERRIATDAIKQAEAVEASIVRQWASAIVANDDAGVQAAVERLAEWNRSNPDTPIRIIPGQIRSRVRALTSTADERLMRTAPRELRGLVPRTE